MAYFTYILFSEKLDRYYIGSMADVPMRLKEHLWSHGGFTSRAKDWELKYSERFATKEMATTRELQIKKWKSRKMVEKLIASQN